jgi:transposase
MLSFSGTLKVFVALEPVDLRKSFSGLEGLVSERLGEDLRQGALFVFANSRHSRLKVSGIHSSVRLALTAQVDGCREV